MPTATIRVDGHPHDVRSGLWVCKDLKAEVGVEPHKVLARVRPMGLKDLQDGRTYEIEDGFNFMTHARAGGAS